MGPTWVLSAPDGPHVGPMNLAFRNITSHVMWPVTSLHIIHPMVSFSTHNHKFIIISTWDQHYPVRVQFAWGQLGSHLGVPLIITGEITQLLGWWHWGIRMPIMIISFTKICSSLFWILLFHIRLIALYHILILVSTAIHSKHCIHFVSLNYCPIMIMWLWLT